MSRYSQIQQLCKCRLVLSLIFVSNIIIYVCLMYGQVLQPKQPVAHMVVPLYEATCSHFDDPTEVLHGYKTLEMHKNLSTVIIIVDLANWYSMCLSLDHWSTSDSKIRTASKPRFIFGIRHCHTMFMIQWRKNWLCSPLTTSTSKCRTKQRGGKHRRSSL